ncbi:hypothetical protein DPMN_172055 [Dreissena polymorpha]|uniref:Uncharacterized protein n=1 Tax=Dreissena polymorpha TaxID=45954 RepID=A0A9D4E2V4_DREPO|nr:hypothetical protein DPMN_172055 [Dreissena polymorpha]
MPTKRQATSSRGVRGRLQSLDNMSNNARSIDDRRSPLNTAIVARRLLWDTKGVETLTSARAEKNAARAAFKCCSTSKILLEQQIYCSTSIFSARAEKSCSTSIYF